MYLPADGAVLTAHQITGTQAQDVAAAVRDMLDLGSVDATHGPIVLSQVAGTHAPVTTARVDTKPDIQRRRAESLAPASVHHADLTPR